METAKYVLIRSDETLHSPKSITYQIKIPQTRVMLPSEVATIAVRDIIYRILSKEVQSQFPKHYVTRDLVREEIRWFDNGMHGRVLLRINVEEQDSNTPPFEICYGFTFWEHEVVELSMI